MRRRRDTAANNELSAHGVRCVRCHAKALPTRHVAFSARIRVERSERAKSERSSFESNCAMGLEQQSPLNAFYSCLT